MRAKVTRGAEGFDRRSFTVAEICGLYARHGVNETWVVDAVRRRTFVHSSPEEAG